MQMYIFGPFLVRATVHQLTGLPEYLQQQQRGGEKKKILKAERLVQTQKSLDLNFLWVRE